MQSPDISSQHRKFLSLQISHPLLLVSVRDVSEAKIAMTGGCDVLDIKEPTSGSLGMAESKIINEIAECGTRSAEQPEKGTNQKASPPVSAALGEVVEWEDRSEVVGLSSQLSYFKIGLAGLGNDPNWLSRWLNLRNKIEEQFKASPTTPRWIAVAYADWEQAHAPHPQLIFEAAIATHCAGFLIDTFTKDGRTLFDQSSEAELIKLSLRAKEHHLLFAVAGSLQVESLPQLITIQPDIIAIRSAACHQGERTKGVSQTAIESFRATMLELF